MAYTFSPNPSPQCGQMFMLPGVDHCGLQAGPGITQDGIDLLTALEDWVEKGKAPEQILMTKTKDDQTEWTRPACPWPAKAAFSGRGDWRDAQSWRCVAE